MNWLKIYDMLHAAKDKFDKAESVTDMSHWLGYITALQEVLLLDAETLLKGLLNDK